MGLVIVAALAFDFANGFHDTANAMATSIATDAFKSKTAVALAGVMNLVGAFLSTEVAKTILGGIINEQQVAIGAEFILAGLIDAIVWNLITWLVGLPSSSSHALMGGLVGAVIVGAGVEGVDFLVVIQKTLIPEFVSHLVAELAAWLAVKLVFRIVRGMEDSRVTEGFRHGQTVTACLVALSHGTNDAQKTMCIITLIAAGIQPSGSGLEFWVVAACGVTIALGTYMDEWRVIRTLGRGLTDITAPQGFVAEAASATIILASSYMGFALSTTQVCSGSIIGSGLGKRESIVNWSVAGRMLVAWIVTFPAAGTVGAIAKTGFSGIVLAVGIAIGILLRSRRNPVDATNANDASEARVVESSVFEARIVDQGAVVGHAQGGCSCLMS